MSQVDRALEYHFDTDRAPSMLFSNQFLLGAIQEVCQSSRGRELAEKMTKYDMRGEVFKERWHSFKNILFPKLYFH